MLISSFRSIWDWILWGQYFWEIDLDFPNIEMNSDIIAVKDLWYLSLSTHLNDATENSSYTLSWDRYFTIWSGQCLAPSISFTQKWSSSMCQEYKVIFISPAMVDKFFRADCVWKWMIRFDFNEETIT